MTVHIKSLRLFLASLLLAPVVAVQAKQESSTPDAKVDFGRDILPILETHCFVCHGPEKQESNYRLDIKSRALGTADYGDPPIVPGNSAESPLIEFVAGDGDMRMPPVDSGAGLNDEQIELLRRWIDEGATWPDELANEENIKLTTDHWSFQPLADVQPPRVDSKQLPNFQLKNGIDHFIARRLIEHGLQPSEPADPVTLIRRIYLDMHGLQPTPDQVKNFVKDLSPDSWDRLIDEVLASHHYGERWARHWLDIVRFGESTGYEVNRDRANAWYYRDYVINSLNEDKSWRDFVIEQLAGDAVGVDEATGFLVGGAYDTVKSPDINLTLMQREDELADYVNTTSTAFLGLTVGCARCHNHKFDPILQSDYYSLQAVFAGVRHGERKLSHRADPQTLKDLETARHKLLETEKQFADMKAAAPPVETDDKNLLQPVNAKQNTDSFESVTAKFLRFSIFATNSFEPCIDELEIFTTGDQNIALATKGSKATSSGDYVGNPIHQLAHINDGKYGNSRSWISNTSGEGWVQIEFKEPFEINRVVWGRDRTEKFADRLAIVYSISVSSDGETWQEVASSSKRKPFLIDGKEPDGLFIARLEGEDKEQATQLRDEIAKLRGQITKLDQSIPSGYLGTFAKPKTIHRLYRGDPMSPREVVQPDTLEVMGSLNLDNSADEQTRRLKFAQWIASDENPLTARVIVNRVWQFHFGQGLVSTPSDFGKAGQKPSHPELLDWLASEFMENGWSLKWLHRTILQSATYQQSSRPRKSALAKDAGSRWLWRFPPRRLEAEAIRDCVLQLSGKLNLQTGGPGFLLFKVDRENVHHYFPLEKFEPKHFRRMIYMTKIRQEQDEVFGVFDCPDGGQTIPTRSRSTTALQALNLLNSKFMLEQAGFLAERIEAEAGDDTNRQIHLLFELAYSRLPTDDELSDVAEFVEQFGLKAFCRILFNSNEFLFMG